MPTITVPASINRADETPPPDRWAAAAVTALTDYDVDAAAGQRVVDAEHAADHLE